jgi:Protein of unknown function (DUF1838)
MRMRLLAAAVAVCATAASAQQLDLSKPEDALTANRKMQCSTVDGEPTFYHWSGRTYARRAGEPDKLLFRVEGMNVRQCTSVTDPKRGKGYRMVSREIMLYLDPKTGEVLRTWENPWTGESVEVLHVANDPVNMRRPSFPYDENGKPYAFEAQRSGDYFLQAVEVPLFYTNPLGGDYQDYVGNTYHAMEIFDFVAPAAKVLSLRTTKADPAVAWVRIAQWLPWMRMRSRDGFMVTNAVGRMVGSFEDYPAVLKDEIRKNYPDYTAPPPADDARPNETSWTVFRKWADAKKTEKK